MARRSLVRVRRIVYYEEWQDIRTQEGLVRGVLRGVKVGRMAGSLLRIGLGASVALLPVVAARLAVRERRAALPARRPFPALER